MKSTDAGATAAFADLGLSKPVLEALADVGYESPSPIQAATIPLLLAGADILGQAQTGTGKTAAFALPLLTKIVIAKRDPQALVMVPTRELAIQVAEAFQTYAARIRGFHVLPIYGGQSYGPQFHALARGPHVVVGTPGRIIDHLERGTLSLAGLRFVVLDEGDEMLQMGFIDAIESILARTPAEKQVALFSATLPPPIKRIARKHLREPHEITIQSKTTTAPNIRQRYWMVSGMHKLDALTRILEVEPFDAMLVFARTRQATVELAERLEARGFAAAALNGEIAQARRERIVAALKARKIDILVATDVAARGLDVERIDHVVNFDVPYDTESYVHRIGRTGRAGRTGEAILFVAPRERTLLRAIERATRQPIEPMRLPSVADVNLKRLARFKERVAAALATGETAAYRPVVEEIARESGADTIDVAAALASLAQGETPLLLAPERAARDAEPPRTADAPQRPLRAEVRPSAPPGARDRTTRRPRSEREDLYRLEVGHIHGIKAGNIVGLIANEAGLEGAQINGVSIEEDHSFVRLPEGMPPSSLALLHRIRLEGRPHAMRLVERGLVERATRNRPRFEERAHGKRRPKPR